MNAVSLFNGYGVIGTQLSGECLDGIRARVRRGASSSSGGTTVGKTKVNIIPCVSVPIYSHVDFDKVRLGVWAKGIDQRVL